jgi:hypothetical protein
MKNPVFWALTPCSLFKVKRSFGGTCRLHLQSGRISQARNQHEASSKQPATTVICRYSATQEFSNISWNTMVHYRVFKRLPMVPILSQISPVYTAAFYSLTYISILFSHLRVVRPSLSFWLSHKISTCVCLLSYACSMPCPSHPLWLDQSAYIWRRLQVMEALIMLFSPTSYYFIPSLLQYNLKYIYLFDLRERDDCKKVL